MKQAYTNTIRGGANRPLTIQTAQNVGRNKQLIPKCAYGAACTRKDCAYRHPDVSVGYECYEADPKSKICKPFLAGLCTYGHKCMNRHPGQAEADAVRATYKEKTCSYGDDCQTEGCLYWHPYEEHEVVENAAEYTTTGEGQQLTSAMGGLHLDASGTLTYEQWLAYNCPSPPTMDENEVYKAWYYPGSGMQRDPWEVYCLMYPQNYNSTASGESNNGGLNATSQTWQPVSAAPQSWEPATNTNYQQQQQQQQVQNADPQSFQEWKKRGQPNPSWFSSYINIDPWYDDEGMRRDLEEVYEVLYGPNAEEKFAQKKYEQEIANDPTPAELAAMIDSKEDVQLGTSPVIKDPVPAKSGGWASIAAKPPAPVAKTTATISGGRSRSNSNASSSGKAEALSVSHKSKMVVIPKEVWLPSTANSDCFHLFPNPIERFKAVNSHHKSYLASVTIPLCFDSNKNNSIQPKGKVTLLDVHFQSAKTITPVLNRFLVPALKKNDEVWIVTGSGHHVAVGHQKREGGGVLFNAVKRYLEDHGDEIEMKIGKDTSGGKNKNGGGAFLVRHRTT